MKNIITYILYIISISAFLLASGIKEVVNWLDLARPYFAVGFATLALALILSNTDNIRRYTYPAIVCVWAWLYEHKIIKTQFGKSTYIVYKRYGKSYSTLFDTVQDAFDTYLALSKQV